MIMCNNKLLVIGSLPTNSSKSFGGATVLFKEFVEYLEQCYNGDFLVFNLSRKAPFIRPVFAIFSLTFYIINKRKKFTHIVVNVSQNGLISVAPLVIFLSFILNKKAFVRYFGGDLIAMINKSKVHNIFVPYILRSAEGVFVETKKLVEEITKINSQIYWFPNTRKAVNFEHKTSFGKKFIFIGHIKEEKGINLILESLNELPSDVVVEIYGPIVDPKFNYIKNIKNYKGILKPEQVAQKLQEFDVLLLPTFYKGEGYPGVIIEAYSLGLPCITTNWMSIPEIVDNNIGILIEPKNLKELISAINSFDPKNYLSFHRKVIEKFSDFESVSVHHRIITIINSY